MPDSNDALIGAVRIAIYSAIEATGHAPAAADVARARGVDTAAVEDAYRALADAHVIVLEPGTVNVRAGRSSWYAPCAWDAFGVPAALDCDARVEASCAWSGEPIPCGVEHGRAYGAGVIHLVVPAARFWDNIFYT